MESKNIAIVNTGNWGSTGKIAKNLFLGLQIHGYHTLFCHGHGTISKDDGTEYLISSKWDRFVHSAGSRLFGNQGCYSWDSTKRFLKRLEQEKVDTIITLSLHGNYLNQTMFFDYVASHDIKLVYIMIDEYPFVGKCGGTMGCDNYKAGCQHCPHIKMYPPSMFLDRASYLYKMKARNYAKLNKAVFVGPEFVINNARKSPMMEGKKMCVLDETIDVTTYSPKDYKHLKNELQIDDNKIVIECVASLTSGYKGAAYFEKLAKRFEKDERFVFVHVASELKGVTRPVHNLIMRGFIESQEELATYMSMADLFVFPSLQDTMSNTCIEALACGSPLLCFNISGMPYLANEEVMTLVEPKNVEQMATIVNKTEGKTQSTINKCREYALSRYDSRDYCKRIIDLMSSMD